MALRLSPFKFDQNTRSFPGADEILAPFEVRDLHLERCAAFNAATKKFIGEISEYTKEEYEEMKILVNTPPKRCGEQSPLPLFI